MESQRSTFSGGKRGREEEDEEEKGIENFHRKRHEWLYSVVSGAGGWKSSQPSQPVRFDGQGRGRGGATGGVKWAGRGEAVGVSGGAGRGAAKGPFGQGSGMTGGNYN